MPQIFGMRERVQAARTASPETLDLLARLESTQSSQWEILGKTRDDVTTLNTQLSVVQRDLLTLGTQIQSLLGKMDDIRKPNIAVWGLIITVIVFAIPGINFYTDSAIAPVKAENTRMGSEIQSLKGQLDRQITNSASRDQELGKLAQTATSNAAAISAITSQLQRTNELALASAQADTTSRTDRAQLNDRMAKSEARLSDEQSARRSAESANRVHLGEIETQFHAVSNIENLRWAWQNRFNSIVFQKTHPGENWPADTFFPPTIFQSPAAGSPTISSNNRD